MFHLIEPEDHHLYLDLILPFLRGLSCNQTDSFENLNNATFLLAKDEKNTMKGGALLVKNPIENLHPEVQEHLYPFYSDLPEVWRGIVSLQIKEDVSGRDFEKICQLFYQILYGDLIAFGVKENAPFLFLTMDNVEHLLINMQGYWPYDFAVKSPASGDGLFHGVLKLTRNHRDAESSRIPIRRSI